MDPYTYAGEIKSLAEVSIPVDRSYSPWVLFLDQVNRTICSQIGTKSGQTIGVKHILMEEYTCTIDRYNDRQTCKMLTENLDPKL
jgi:hypothetical protein